MKRRAVFGTGGAARCGSACGLRAVAGAREAVRGSLPAPRLALAVRGGAQ